jgi:hypothetical protein
MIWGWWRKKRRKYPSSLYVTVQGLNPPRAGGDQQKAAFAAGIDGGIGENKTATKAPKIPVWSRLPGQVQNLKLVWAKTIST